MSGDLLWRFTTMEDRLPFRRNPYDSLMEARSDAWLLQWESETGTRGGEVMCVPLLVEFALECAEQAAKAAFNREWAMHWHTAAAYGNPVVGARGAARHAILSFRNDVFGLE